MAKPLPIPNVWTASAQIRVIDFDETRDAMIWKTVARCIDTPNAIKEAVRQARAAGYTKLWSTGTVSGRQYHG